MYRYRRLPMAKKNAEKLGCRGALYPWQSADDGGEETQEQHYNPLSGEWGPDLSRRQRHVSIAIAYNFYSYFTITNDYRFFYKYGAEILVEIVRFWVSICTYDQTTRRYSITGVMGPDEFHEKYTWSEKPGLKDNSYTNIMVAWLMKKTLETIRIMPDSIYKKFTARMNISKTEMATWNKISSKMNVCFSDSGILMQFDGYDKLKDIDWKYYKEKYTDIHRMDRILKSEGDTPDQYKVAKQADVLMLFYLLSPAQVKEMLGLMEYSIGDENEFMKKNYQYYVYRTSHGSTLSYVVHSALYKYGNIEPTDRWTWFLNALKSDIYDTQGGTTTEGIHCGVMAGTIDIIIKSFAGINFSGDGIEINPRLPKHWQTLQFNVLYRGSSIHFKITQTMLRMKLNADSPRGIVFVVNKKRHILRNRNVLLINYRNQR